jgi:hypothetical protein
MLQALISTLTELLDSKKAAYSFIATIMACVLHLYFGVSVENALLLVSPLGVATISQAHVDAASAKSAKSANAPVAAAVTTTTTVVTDPAPATDAPKDETKTEG